MVEVDSVNSVFIKRLLDLQAVTPVLRRVLLPELLQNRNVMKVKYQIVDQMYYFLFEVRKTKFSTTSY